VGVAPRGGGGRGGPGAVPGRRYRLVGGTCACGQHRTGEVGSPTSGPRATVTGSGGLNWIRMQIQTNSNKFKSFQTLTDPKKHFPVLRKIEIKYDFECLEKMNNFLHRTPSDLEGISIENLGKSLGFEFNGI
jgi:hypothetical protein